MIGDINIFVFVIDILSYKCLRIASYKESVTGDRCCKEGIWLRSRRRDIHQGAAVLQPAGGY